MIIHYVDCEKGRLLKDENGENLTHIFSNLPFRIQKITLSPTNTFSQQLLSKAKWRLSNIKFNVANSSGVAREEVEVKLKSFCGLIIEQLCYSMLNHYNTNENVQIVLDDSFNAVDQIDLKIYKSWLDRNEKKTAIKTAIKTVEIRSSFPFKPIEKAVSQDFDILGGYKNHVKKGEIEKDFYLRFLFALEYPKDHYVRNGNKIDYSKTTTNVLRHLYFDDELNLKKEMTIYFIGGATHSMMSDDSISYNGSMRSHNFNQDNNAQYRKLKVRNALDCVAIMQMMLNVITTESSEGK